MRTRSALLLAAAAALLTGGMPAAGAVADTPAARSAPTAEVWLTTPDGSSRLADAGAVAFTDTGSAAIADGVPTVVVDPGRTFQTMTGFGAALTDSAASVLYRLDPTARDRAMRDLFDPATGDGLSYLRQPIGASDFTDGPAYTYDDMPAGQTDFGLAHFSVAHDATRILPLLRRAQQLNPRLGIMATPWSPPAWMKTNDSLVGGRLIDDPRIYHAYAAYLVAFVQAYRAQGVRVDALTVQNEPQNRTPSGYPGTDLPSWQEAKVIDQLGPMLRAAGLKTKILGYDHNWTEHPGDVAATPADETADIEAYARNLLATDASRWISGTAFHCYSGDPGAMSAFHRRFPDQDVYFTECSGSESADPAQTFADTLKWHARNLVIGAPRNWAKTVVNWNLALDDTNGPHNGGCSTCTGVLTIGQDGSVTRNAEYYTLGHLARFVQPGAVRIASTSFGTTGWNGQVMDVAFHNPDGSQVLVAHNENDNPQTFAVREGDRTFQYTLPGGALATFVWKGAHEDTARPLDPGTWTATATVGGASASAAVDDDASTRFSTGAAQTPGQSLQVDLGAARPVRRLVLDTGASTGDYPRGWTAQTSRDGVHWTTAAQDVSGSGQFTTLALDGQPVRYVRFTLTRASGSWWSVADVRAYR